MESCHIPILVGFSLKHHPAIGYPVDGNSILATEKEQFERIHIRYWIHIIIYIYIYIYAYTYTIYYVLQNKILDTYTMSKWFLDGAAPMISDQPMLAFFACKSQAWILDLNRPGIDKGSIWSHAPFPQIYKYLFTYSYIYIYIYVYFLYIYI